MRKKVVVLGGGTGLSILLRGLKNFPLDITAVVSVSDNGSSTGVLRKEFNTPAVGDIRKVIVSLAETEPLIEEMLNYRFKTYSDLNNHTIGNLLLTAATNITGNLSDGIEALSKTLNLKGRVVPLTEENVTLMAKMKDGKVIEGEEEITKYPGVIKKIYYKTRPKVNDEVLKSISEADIILLSMGSVYTSILPNLICNEVKREIDKSNAKIMYACNIMTQPGETDNYNVSDHIKLLNKYLGRRKIDVVVVNDKKIPMTIRTKYETLEQKDQVIYDKEEVDKLKVEVISGSLITIEDDMIRHDTNRLASYIFLYIL